MQHSTIAQRIDDAIDDFFLDKGKQPNFIVLSMHAWTEASYEIGKDRGLEDMTAIVNDLEEYRGITIAVTHRKNTPDIEVG